MYVEHEYRLRVGADYKQWASVPDFLSASKTEAKFPEFGLLDDKGKAVLIDGNEVRVKVVQSV